MDNLGIKVMVVEDEFLLLEAIEKKLKLNGFEVVSCSSGHQAIDYLKNLPELPDAIWLDYHLGDMDGITIMQEIKKSDKLSKIPVIVVSNSASPDKVQNMLELGAKKYLLKAEYRLDDLIAEVKKFVQAERAHE
ncbi:MAG: hypothetical protein ACD_52C00164G0003 [uncultured bacterium]|nr:MAG: hypothetical protein ACD_52C00164G0003 [uncultured bacterium]